MIKHSIFAKILSVCILLECLSCTTKSYNKSLNFTTSEASFHLDTNDLYPANSYVNDFHFFTENDSAYSIYIKDKTLDIYLCNLSREGEKRPIIITLDSNEMKAGQFGQLLAIHRDNDKIAFFQESRFGLYDLATDKVIYDHPIDSHDSIEMYFQQDYGPAHIHLVDSLNEIYVSVVHSINEENRKYLYDCTFHAKINWKSNDLEMVPVKFPESFGNGELGFRTTIGTLYKRDSIIYSYSSEDSLTIYDKTSGKITKKKAKSGYETKMTKLDVDHWDEDKNSELSNTEFTYDEILYNPWKKNYYRIYSLSQELKNEKGLFNLLKDKQKGVIVLDKDFHYIGEAILPDKGLSIFGTSRAGLIYKVNDTIINNLSTLKTINFDY